MPVVDIVQKFACTDCDITCFMGNSNQKELFPYDNNRTPRCAKCKAIVKRFCDCGQTFPYNGKVKKYREHLFACQEKRAEEEARLEREREAQLKKEEEQARLEAQLKKEEEQELQQMMAGLSLTKLKDVKKYIQDMK